MRWLILVITFITIAQAPRATVVAAPADDQFFNASTHYSQGHWQQARESFQAFLAAHPTHLQSDQARFYLGETLVQLHDYVAAADHFQSLLTRRMGDALGRKVLYRAGESAYFAKLYDRANEQLTRFINEYPSDKLNAYVLAYLGDIALEKGDADKAMKFYSEGLERFPQGALCGDCRLGLGRVLERQNKPAEALKVYDEAIARNDAWSDDAWLRVATLHVRQKSTDKAVEAYQTLIVKYATSPLVDQARLGLAQAYLSANKTGDAEAILGAIPASSTLAADARYQLGMLQLQRKAPAEAVRSFEAAIAANAKHPQLAEMSLAVAQHLAQSGKTDEARPWFERAASASSSGDQAAQALLGLIETAVANGDQPQLIAAANRFVRQYPDHAQRITAELHLARDLLSANKTVEAIQLLEPALARPVNAKADASAPRDRISAHYLLALAYQAAGRGPGVLKALKPVLDSTDAALVETRQQAWRLQAAVLVTQNQFDAAIPALVQYLKQPASDGEQAARAQLAICYARTKNALQAKQALSAFLATKPSDELRKATTEALTEAAMAIEDETIAADLIATLAQNGASIDPNLSAYHAARAAEKQGKFEQAATTYQRLVATPPPGITADLLLYNAGWAWKQAGKPTEARQAFESLTRDHPQSRYWSDVTYRLAELALEAKQVEQARTWLDALIKRETSGDILIHALYLQGQLAMQTEQWADVTTPLTRIIELAPQHALRPLAEFWLAEAAYRQRQFDVALKRLEALAPQASGEVKPSWAAMVPLRRAQILVQQKKFTEAREIAEKIATDFPQFEQQYEVDYVIGRAHASAAEFDEAREAYQRVIRSPRGGRSETAAMAQWMLAETYFHQRNYEAALKEYLRVETVYAYPTWQALGLLQAGKCYEQLGQWSQASETYARLIKNHPQSSHAQEASQR
ncbi:MAG: tetratricopeptide repeat protein, partial [Planctomycetaceae bacterium]|nr:tetratricopeptide repeat protein [Planctomycetaceae bacterium]